MKNCFCCKHKWEYKFLIWGLGELLNKIKDAETIQFFYKNVEYQLEDTLDYNDKGVCYYINIIPIVDHKKVEKGYIRSYLFPEKKFSPENSLKKIKNISPKKKKAFLDFSLYPDLKSIKEDEDISVGISKVIGKKYVKIYFEEAEYCGA